MAIIFREQDTANASRFYQRGESRVIVAELGLLQLLLLVTASAGAGFALAMRRPVRPALPLAGITCLSAVVATGAFLGGQVSWPTTLTISGVLVGAMWGWRIDDPPGVRAFFWYAGGALIGSAGGLMALQPTGVGAAAIAGTCVCLIFVGTAIGGFPKRPKPNP